MRQVENYRHHIDKPWTLIRGHLPQELIERGDPLAAHLTDLPVSLRYQFDAGDFQGNREELYNQTIGSDVWMNAVYALLDTLIDAHNKQLGKHNRIVKIADIKEGILAPEYRRY